MKILSKLFQSWVKAYPDLPFTDDVCEGLAKGWEQGHFATALIEGNLDAAFASADPFNLKRLEKLVNMTRDEHEKLRKYV